MISARMDSLNTLIAGLEKSQHSSNGDHITINRQRGTDHFYIYSEEGSRRHVSDKRTISDFATRRYNAVLLDAAIKERRQLERCLKHLKKKESNSDIEEVFASFPKQLKDYVVLDGTTDDGFASKWMAKYSSITEKDKHHIFKTIRGDYVRSKSEAIIADRLYSLGIPYAYEKLGLYDDERADIIHPDFLVLNKTKRKEFIWEHCGIMDDGKYCNESLHRLKVLSKHGYLQGKNLLFSYETKDTPLDMGYVELLIKNYLV